MLSIALYGFCVCRFAVYSYCAPVSSVKHDAPDAGESGDLPSIFLRLIIFPLGRRPAARPSAGNASRWALRGITLGNPIQTSGVLNAGVLYQQQGDLL